MVKVSEKYHINCKRKQYLCEQDSFSSLKASVVKVSETLFEQFSKLGGGCNSKLRFQLNQKTLSRGDVVNLSAGTVGVARNPRDATRTQRHLRREAAQQ